MYMSVVMNSMFRRIAILPDWTTNPSKQNWHLLAKNMHDSLDVCVGELASEMVNPRHHTEIILSCGQFTC